MIDDEHAKIDLLDCENSGFATKKCAKSKGFRRGSKKLQVKGKTLRQFFIHFVTEETI